MLIKSLLIYSKECKKSWFLFHLTVLIEMTDMWYTEWHFLRCVFEVFFFMVIHAVRSRQAGSGKVLWLQKEILKQLECIHLLYTMAGGVLAVTWITERAKKREEKRRTHNEHSGIFVLALIVGTLQGLKFLYSSLRHCLGSVSRRRGVIVYKFILNNNSINMENPWFATVLQGIMSKHREIKKIKTTSRLFTTMI